MDNLYSKLKSAETFMNSCEDIVKKVEEESSEEKNKIIKLEKFFTELERNIINKIVLAVILTDCIARCFGGKEEKNDEILQNVAHVVGSYFKIQINHNLIINGIKQKQKKKIIEKIGSTLHVVELQFWLKMIFLAPKLKLITLQQITNL